MQTRHLLFLILIGITDGTLKFKCVPGIGENEKVDIQINRLANTIESPGLLNITDDAKCAFFKNTTFYVLKDCPPGEDINVTATRPGENGTVSKTNVTTYTMQCNWNLAPFTTAVNANLKVTSSPILEQPDHENVEVPSDYNLKPNLKMNISSTNEVISIGDQLTVNIFAIDEVTKRIKFSAETCTAKSPTQKYVYDLWTSDDCSTVDKNFFNTSDWHCDAAKDLISHPLQAFRFIDSYTVKLECKVKICPIGKENECHMKCGPNSRGRKRRAVTGRTTTLETSFNLVDSVENISSRAPESYLATPLISMVVLLCEYLHLF